MPNNISRPGQEQQRGQTILLVAFSLVVILGMAALAIDVVTLYTARSEAQRSADAAALAGAKMLVDSGMTEDGYVPVKPPQQRSKIQLPGSRRAGSTLHFPTEGQPAVRAISASIPRSWCRYSEPIYPHSSPASGAAHSPPYPHPPWPKPTIHPMPPAQDRPCQSRSAA